MTPLPVDLQANAAASLWFLAGGALFFVVSLSWAVHRTRTSHSALPLFALAGGLLASFAEAWIDRIIQLWYPAEAPLVVFTVLGVHQPLWVQLYYPGFVGLGAYVTYLGLLRYPNGRLVWATFLGICVMDLAFEGPATFFGAYHYYGQQPFQLWDNGWPLWVAPINAAGPVVGGWLIFRFRHHLTGRSTAWAALLPPLAYAGVYGATAWPTATALNSDVSTPIRWGAAALTMVLAVLVATGLRTLARHVDEPLTSVPVVTPA